MAPDRPPPPASGRFTAWDPSEDLISPAGKDSEEQLAIPAKPQPKPDSVEPEPQPEPQPKAKAKAKAEEDPFAEDPLAAGDVEAPCAEELTEEDDPFASKHKGKTPHAKAKATPSTKPKEDDPFAEDPLAGDDVDLLDAEALDDPDDPFASKHKGKTPVAKAKEKPQEKAEPAPKPRATAPKPGKLADSDLIAPKKESEPEGPAAKPRKAKAKTKAKEKKKETRRQGRPAVKATPKETKEEKGEDAPAEPPAKKVIDLPVARQDTDCAHCRQPVESGDACPECGIALHAACRVELARCPSAECSGSKSFSEPATARSRSTLLVAAACLVLVGTVSIVGLSFLNKHQDASDKQAFLQLVPTLSAKQALWHGERLRPRLRDDPQVKAVLEELHGRVEREEARGKAQEQLNALKTVLEPKRRLAACEAALKIDPTFALAYVERARLRLRQARRDAPRDRSAKQATLVKAALVDLNQGIHHEPRQAWCFYERGMIYARLRKQQAALTDLEKVIELERATDSTLRALAMGQLAALAGKHLEAISQFERALKGNKRLSGAHLARGRALLRLGKAAAALEAAGWARKTDPHDPEAYVLMVESRRRAAPDRSASLRDLDRAISLDPIHGHALALRSSLRLQRDPQGRPTSPTSELELARKDAERALLHDPTQPLASLTLAELALHRGDRAKALRLIKRALERGEARDHLPVRRLRARIRVGQGDSGPTVFKDLDAVLAAAPNDVLALVLRGQAHRFRGNLSAARADLDQALFLDPALESAYYTRGLVHLGANDLRLAIADFTTFLERKPSSGDAHLQRALAYHRARRFRRALRDVRRAKQLGAKVSRLTFLRLEGDMHYHRHQWKIARDAYRELLRLAAKAGKPVPEIKARLAECEKSIKGGFRIH